MRSRAAPARPRCSPTWLGPRSWSTSTAGRTAITRCCGSSCRMSSRRGSRERPRSCTAGRHDGTSRPVTLMRRSVMPSPRAISTMPRSSSAPASVGTTGQPVARRCSRGSGGSGTTPSRNDHGSPPSARGRRSRQATSQPPSTSRTSPSARRSRGARPTAPRRSNPDARCCGSRCAGRARTTCARMPPWPWRSNSPAVAGATSRCGCWRSRTWSTETWPLPTTPWRRRSLPPVRRATTGWRTPSSGTVRCWPWIGGTGPRPPHTPTMAIGSLMRCRSMGISRAPTRASPVPASPSIAATSAQRDGRCFEASICDRC